MLYTRENVRDNLRTQEGKRVFFLGAGDNLTSAARDFLKEQRIPILPAENAKITRYETLDGGFLEEKPEHLTQLTGNLLVPKTHPRIVFRGKLDSLEAALLLEARALPEKAKALEEILGCVRKLLRCEVLEEPFVPETLCGLTEREERIFRMRARGASVVETSLALNYSERTIERDSQSVRRKIARAGHNRRG